MNYQQVLDYLKTNGLSVAVKLLGALVIWTLGRWLIAFVLGLVGKAIRRGGKLDPTLTTYITSVLSVLLTIGLTMGILGYLGVETASFAALLAGVGLAVGTAWGGLLTHFAAGAFLQILRPFAVGNYVVAGGVEGTVQEIGLFGTTILSPDNVRTTVGNNKIFSEVIKNYSAEPHRRVECVAKVANSVDPRDAIARLTPAILAVKNVLATPAPTIEILELTAEGPRLCVRPHCHTDHYWQVYFDVNRAIVDTFTKADYPPAALPVSLK